MYRQFAIVALLPSIVSCSTDEERKKTEIPPNIMSVSEYLSYKYFPQAGYSRDYSYLLRERTHLSFRLDFFNLYTDSVYAMSDSFSCEYCDNVFLEKYPPPDTVVYDNDTLVIYSHSDFYPYGIPLTIADPSGFPRGNNR